MRILRGESPIYIPSKAVDYEHIEHCRNVIAAPPQLIGIKVEVNFGLGKCVRLDGTGRSATALPLS